MRTYKLRGAGAEGFERPANMPPALYRLLVSRGIGTAAERAVRRARFVPASSGGRPVASRARLKLEFKLK